MINLGSLNSIIRNSSIGDSGGIIIGNGIVMLSNLENLELDL